MYDLIISPGESGTCICTAEHEITVGHLSTFGVDLYIDLTCVRLKCCSINFQIIFGKCQNKFYLVLTYLSEHFSCSAYAIKMQ